MDSVTVIRLNRWGSTRRKIVNVYRNLIDTVRRFEVNVHHKSSESEVTVPMKVQATLLLVLFCAVAYKLAFAAGTVLVFLR